MDGIEMTTTEQDLRALHYLAKRIRQDLNGAGEWDDQGLMATLRKLQGRRLADLALAVARAADDRTAKTPGVLTAADSLHWRERNKGERTATRRPFDRATTCSICANTEELCRWGWADDHEFTPVAQAVGKEAAPPPEDYRQARRALVPSKPDRRPYVPENDQPEEPADGNV